MEIRIVIFLAFVAITLVTNTIMIFFAYKALAGLTSKMTETMSAFTKNSETREALNTIKAATEQIASITESAKAGIAEFDPKLRRLEENYRQILVTADSKLEKTANDVSTAAQRVRDVIAKPAFAVVSFSAGVHRVMEDR